MKGEYKGARTGVRSTLQKNSTNGTWRKLTRKNNAQPKRMRRKLKRCSGSLIGKNGGWGRKRSRWGKIRDRRKRIRGRVERPSTTKANEIYGIREVKEVSYRISWVKKRGGGKKKVESYSSTN